MAKYQSINTNLCEVSKIRYTSTNCNYLTDYALEKKRKKHKLKEIFFRSVDYLDIFSNLTITKCNYLEY